MLVQLLIARRLLPLLEHRFAPPAYDDRRILLDLSEAARAATNTDELYRYIVEMIRDALRSENVSLFVRRGAGGEFVCRVSAESGAEAPQPPADEMPSLRSDAFVVKRLRNLAIPLHIEPQDLETWVRALDNAPPAWQEARAEECATLRRLRSSLMLQIKMKDQLVGILSIGRQQSARKFSAKDEQMLMSVTGQLALVIENSKLVERMVEAGPNLKTYCRLNGRVGMVCGSPGTRRPLCPTPSEGGGDGHPRWRASPCPNP